MSSVNYTFSELVSQTIEYKCDASENRVKKEVMTNTASSTVTERTSYIYDASGVVVAIYEEECEQLLYGLTDTDLDSIPDIYDNCPMTFNPDQGGYGRRRYR